MSHPKESLAKFVYVCLISCVGENNVRNKDHLQIFRMLCSVMKKLNNKTIINYQLKFSE